MIARGATRRRGSIRIGGATSRRRWLEDRADFSVEAVLKAITDFRTDQVPDRSAAYAPSVAEFVGHARKCQTAIDVAQFWEKTDFVLLDSAEWKGVCEARDVRSMPSIEYKGPRGDLRGSFGWYVEKAEVQRAAPLIAKHRKEMLRIEKRRPLRLPAVR